RRMGGRGCSEFNFQTSQECPGCNCEDDRFKNSPHCGYLQRQSHECINIVAPGAFSQKHLRPVQMTSSGRATLVAATKTRKEQRRSGTWSVGSVCYPWECDGGGAGALEGQTLGLEERKSGPTDS